ncbi:hypothetical protein SVIOM342S_01953 [Streptomyces violaceorubidus]
MFYEVACGELDLTHPDRVAVVDQDVGGHRDALGVEPPGVGAGAGGRDDLGERLPAGRRAGAW